MRMLTVHVVHDALGRAHIHTVYHAGSQTLPLESLHAPILYHERSLQLTGSHAHMQYAMPGLKPCLWKACMRVSRPMNDNSSSQAHMAPVMPGLKPYLWEGFKTRLHAPAAPSCAQAQLTCSHISEQCRPTKEFPCRPHSVWCLLYTDNLSLPTSFSQGRQQLLDAVHAYCGCKRLSGID